ncbi:MAG: RNA polymerase sigma factor [Myxococcales bacterium]|nr:RNA polymerase sigma factor [Myxococcales bacterium]
MRVLEQAFTTDREVCDPLASSTHVELSSARVVESMTTSSSTSQDAPTTQQQIEQDLALAQRVLAGDQKAFREMYRTYSPYFYRRFLRWTNDEEIARDSLQQFFLQCLQHLEKYQGNGVLHAWLNRIATNMMTDRFRRQQTWRSFLERFWPTSQDEPSQAKAIHEQLFLREELRQIVHEVLGRLGADKRMVVLLCDLEGMKIEEAAEELAISVGTVASRLHRGRQELRERLARECKRLGLSIEEFLHD